MVKVSILLCPETVVVCSKLFDKSKLVNFIFPFSIMFSNGLKSLILLLFSVSVVRFFRLDSGVIVEILLLFKFKVVNFYLTCQIRFLFFKAVKMSVKNFLKNFLKRKFENVKIRF